MTLAPTFGDRRIDGPIVGIDAPDAGVVSPTARHGCRNGPASAHEPGASADTQAVAEPAFGKHPPEAPAPHVGRRIGLELAESRFGAECESTGKHAARHRAGHARLPESRHRAPTHRPPSQDRPDRPRQAESDCGYGRNRAVHSVRKKNGNGTRPPMNRRMRPIVR